MHSGRAASGAQIAVSTFFRIILSFPIACFSGALLTDIVYAMSANMMWADFSAWLLAFGLIMAVLAALAGLIELARRRRATGQPMPWLLIATSLLVLLLGFFDNLVHSRDAWTSVVPGGLILSAITVIVMLITAWCGVATTYRFPEVRR